MTLKLNLLGEACCRVPSRAGFATRLNEAPRRDSLMQMFPSKDLKTRFSTNRTRYGQEIQWQYVAKPLGGRQPASQRR
jgi:hypothetical protein